MKRLKIGLKILGGMTKILKKILGIKNAVHLLLFVFFCDRIIKQVMGSMCGRSAVREKWRIF